MVLDADDELFAPVVAGEDRANAVLVVVEAVPGRLVLDGRAEALQARDGLPWLEKITRFISSRSG